METITETAVKCSQCHKERGKKAKPWRSCACGGVLCLNCAPAYQQVPQCSPCRNREFEAEWNKKKNTPVECVGCQQSFLPAEMADTSLVSITGAPRLCKRCDGIVKSVAEYEKQRKRKQNPRGLVEVQFGIHKPAADGGTGYAYLPPRGVKLELGDIVLLPATWLDDIQGVKGPHEGTVVSTYSDYSGDVSSILRLVCKGDR